VDIIHSGETFELGKEVKGGLKAMRKSDSDSELYPRLMDWQDETVWTGADHSVFLVGEIENCLRCGYISSNDLCVSLSCHSEFWRTRRTDSSVFHAF
jgi:hypothetical protein